jgi:hypothetical protein
MVLSVVVTVCGDSSWQFDFGQMGRAGKETWDTLQLTAGLSMDILMLDMVWVVVVLAVEVKAVILMFQSMSMSQMTVSSRDKIVKLVSCVWWVADQIFQLERSQDERG